MKGLAGAILAATPLAALVLYFALSGQQQVRTDQQRMDVKMEIDEAKFDLEFDKMNSEIGGDSMSDAEIAKRKADIARLEEKAESWEKRFDDEFKQMDKDLEELKDAINDQ